jgi:hypothetical protein
MRRSDSGCAKQGKQQEKVADRVFDQKQRSDYIIGI